MALKWLALGNPIMGDDAIALIVTRQLHKQLEEAGFEVVMGETDFDYMLDCLEEGDRIIVCDATDLGGESGTVRMIPLTTAVISDHTGDSSHRSCLLPLLPLYVQGVEGYLIGIEVEQVDLGLELSERVQDQLEQICADVYRYGQMMQEQLFNSKYDKSPETL